MAIPDSAQLLNGFRSFANRGSRNLRLLAASAFCLNLGFGIYMATATNFAVQVLHIVPMQQGKVEAVRELPGFLIVLLAALTMRIAEPYLAGISLGLIALGLAAYYKVHTFSALVLYSLIWSVGIHLWMTLSPSMTLSLSTIKNKGRRLGQISAVSALGTVIGMVLVWLVGVHFTKHYEHVMRYLFLLGGFMAAVGAVFVAMISKDIGHKEKPRLVWKWKYSLYYALTFLEGCRKQIFMTFAIFVLVLSYHTSLKVVAILMIINNVVNFLYSDAVGRIVDHIGEKKVLVFCYACLIPVFIGYATIHKHMLLYVCYCLDNFFFVGSIPMNSYLHKIAEPEDVMPTVAMGVSMNHVAAVTVPLVGGYLWTKYNYPTTFLGGAVVVGISVIMALRMKTGISAQRNEAAEKA